MNPKKLSKLEKAVLVSNLLSSNKEKAFRNFSNFDFYLLQEICHTCEGIRPSWRLHAYFLLNNMEFKSREPISQFEQEVLGQSIKDYPPPETKLQLQALICTQFLSEDTPFQTNFETTLFNALSRKYWNHFKSVLLFTGIAAASYFIIQSL